MMMGREERKTADMLDSILSRFQSGESVARFSPLGDGSHSKELNALVELAVQVKDALTPPAPDQSAYQRVQRNLFLKLRERAANSLQPIRPNPGVRLRALPAFLGLMLVIGILSATLGVVSASASSLPGDLLYPVKTGVEDVRLALAFSPEGELSLISRFSAERAREMAALSVKGRYQDLELAAAQYSKMLEKMLSLKEALQSSGDLASATALDEILGQQVETLMRVQDQVPAQAADAIQGVLDHALGKGQGRQDGGEKPEPDETERRATQTVKSQEHQEEKDLQTAVQLAQKYGLTVEQVLGLFHSTCEGDWKCVREVYRELEKE
jgi:hypothetical protein